MGKSSTTDKNRTDVAEAAIKQMNVALKSLHLYPADHVISIDALDTFLSKLQAYFEPFGRFNIGINKASLTVEGEVIGSDSKIISQLAFQLFRLKLALVSIGPKVDRDQLTSLLTVLCRDPEESTEAGGAVELLWEMQTRDITLSQASAKRIYETDPADSGRERAPDLAQLHQLLFKDTERTGAERKLLKRELFDDADHLATFLMHICGAGSDKEKAAIIAEGALSRFNSLARYDTLDDRNYIFRTIAESLIALDDGLVAEITASLLMTDSAALGMARHSLLGQLSLSELSILLTKTLNLTTVSHNRVADVVANLSVNDGEANELAPQLAKVLPLEPASKARLTKMATANEAKETVDGWQQDPKEPQRLAGLIEDLSESDIATIRAEAITINAGQIKTTAIEALGELAAAEDETEGYTILIDGLRAAFVDATDRHVHDDAITILNILVSELRTRYLEADKMAVIKNAIGDAARRERLEALMDRIEQDETVTLEDGEQYFLLLGSLGVLSLLDILATESSPGRRRLVCRLLVSCGQRNLASVGSKILDHRWYLVRNVAAILGQVGDEGGIRYLERAVTHDDSRVRLETVRALASLGPNALDSLKLLANDSERAIQLEAIAAIGNTRSPLAVPFLSEIASQRDLLNRNTDFRVAAIEALGIAHDETALPMLKKLAGSGPVSAANRLGTAARVAVGLIESGQQ